MHAPSRSTEFEGLALELTSSIFAPIGSTLLEAIEAKLQRYLVFVLDAAA